MQSDKLSPNELLVLLLKQLKEFESQEALLEFDRLQLALDRGKILLKIKAELPHGAFLQFLKSNHVKISPRSAERFMQLAKHEKFLLSNSPILANLTLEKALQLIKSASSKKQQVEEAVLLIPVSALCVTTSFNVQAQEYTVNLKITASAIELLRHKSNMKVVNAAVAEALRNMLHNRSLADLSSFNGN